MKNALKRNYWASIIAQEEEEKVHNNRNVMAYFLNWVTMLQYTHPIQSFSFLLVQRITSSLDIYYYYYCFNSLRYHYNVYRQGIHKSSKVDMVWTGDMHYLTHAHLHLYYRLGVNILIWCRSIIHIWEKSHEINIFEEKTKYPEYLRW